MCLFSVVFEGLRVMISYVLLCFCIVGALGHNRVVAVGDLHGDLEQTLAVLRLANVIDDRKHWIGGNTILVQVGDILDVGPQDIEIVRLLMKLSKQAPKTGGAVEQLLGNHEIRNLRGDFSAANAASLENSGGMVGRQHLLSMDNPVGAYLRTRDAIFVHNEFMFMHGGLSSSAVSRLVNLKGVDEFNQELRRALVADVVSPTGVTGLNLNESNVENVENPILVRSILNVKCSELRKALQHFPGIATVVVGHVPHDSRDFEDWRLCDGKLIDIDFGMSTWKKGTKGVVAALEIDVQNKTTKLLKAEVTLPSWRVEIESLEYGSFFWWTVLSVCVFVIGGVAWGMARSSRVVSLPPQYGTF